MLDLIETKRKELHFIAFKYGLSSRRVIRCSQELDELILHQQINGLSNERTQIVS
ncbi:aspartyl-phosphate phosphatase Spo0E family protein [Salipaludibacillus sp. CF4.18]|uniref:aspartyl-phosphate phosphatase Spo0E family protein n=1 Tax=Salipaludibacillus sp. CF4.18 TaxID=3373081 RepID=UPI003EE77168